MGMGVISLTVNPSGPLVTFLFSVFLPLCSSVLEVLVPETGMPPLEHTKMIPLNCNFRIATQPLWAPHVFKSIHKVTVLARCLFLTTKETLGFYCTMEVRKSMSRVQEVSLGVF